MKEYHTYDGWIRGCRRMLHTILGSEVYNVLTHVTGLTRSDIREFHISAIPWDMLPVKSEDARKFGFASIAEWDGIKGEIYEEAPQMIAWCNRIVRYTSPSQKTHEESNQYAEDIHYGWRGKLHECDPSQTIFGFARKES